MKINRHLVGADVHIPLSNGTISVYCPSVDDVQAIKHVLLDYNRKAEINKLMLT